MRTMTGRIERPAYCALGCVTLIDEIAISDRPIRVGFDILQILITRSRFVDEHHLALTGQPIRILNDLAEVLPSGLASQADSNRVTNVSRFRQLGVSRVCDDCIKADD